MATLESPPSRYRIVEKDRRLIVTDTVTGQRNASADLPTMADLGRVRATAGPPSARVTQPTAPGPDGPTPRIKQREVGQPAPIAANQVKLIAVVIGAVIVVAVLMLTWLWVPLAIALLFPQVRTPVVAAIRTASQRWFSN